MTREPKRYSLGFGRGDYSASDKRWTGSVQCERFRLLEPSGSANVAGPGKIRGPPRFHQRLRVLGIDNGTGPKIFPNYCPKRTLHYLVQLWRHRGTTLICGQFYGMTLVTALPRNGSTA